MPEENNTHADDPAECPLHQPSFWKSRAGIAFAVLLAIAAFYLVTEHRAHFLGALPYALLLACPLMHLLMHRGQGGHRHDYGATSGASSRRDPADRTTGRGEPT